MPVCNQLREVRLKTRLSLTEASIQLNISKPTLHRYEYRPVSRVPCSVIRKVSEFYQKTPASLLNYEKDQFYASPDLSVFPMVSTLSNMRRHFPAYQKHCNILPGDTLIRQYNALDFRGKHLVSVMVRTEYMHRKAFTISP